VLQPGFVGLGTTFAVAEVLQPGFVGLGTTFAVTEVLQPGFVVFLRFEGHDISPVEMCYEYYTTNFFGNIVALFMDRYTSYALNGDSYTLDLKIRIIDKSVLEDLISNAQNAHDGATEGQNSGQYPIGSKAVLQNAISQAQSVLNNTLAKQDQVDQAVGALQQAFNTFNGSVIVGQLEKAKLQAAIGQATSALGSAST